MEIEEDFSPSDNCAEPNERYNLAESLFVGDIKKQAQECLLFFFKKKKFWAGGSINPVHLLNERAVKAVMETTVIDAIDIAYRSLKQCEPENWDTLQEHWDIELVKGILADCAKTGIPKCFAGGLLLVCLEQCHSVETLRRLEKFNYYRDKLAESIRAQQADEESAEPVEAA